MNQTMTLAFLVLFSAILTMQAQASETIDDSVRQIDAADLMQISGGPGTHYVYERGTGTPRTPAS